MSRALFPRADRRAPKIGKRSHLLFWSFLGHWALPSLVPTVSSRPCRPSLQVLLFRNLAESGIEMRFQRWSSRIVGIGDTTPSPACTFLSFCESCLFRGLSEIANACIGRRARIRSYWSSFRGIPTSRKKCVPSIAFQCLTVIDLLSGAVERREASAFDDEEACRSQDRLAATDASGTSAQSRRASMRVHVRPAPVVEASPCPSLFRRTSHPRSDTRRLQHRARIGRQGRNELCIARVAVLIVPVQIARRESGQFRTGDDGEGIRCIYSK